MYTQFIVLFAIMFTGYFFRKKNIIDDAMNHGLNKFIVYFAYPCLIVHNIGSLEMSGGLIIDFLIMLAVCCGCFVIYGVYTYFYSKVRKFPKENANIVEFSTAAPNDGFMGFPIALIFFGEKGLFLMLAHNAAMNLFCFTYGLKLVRRNKAGKRKFTPRAIPRAILKLLVNPNILGLLIGFVLSLSGKGVPGPVDQYLLYIGNVATPMAMIFIGSTLANCKLMDIIKNHVVIEASIGKLIVLPLITFLCVQFTPLDPLLKAIVILGCCFPAGATVSMLAEQEGQDQNMSSMILFLSTVASIATIPLAINLIDTFVM